MKKTKLLLIMSLYAVATVCATNVSRKIVDLNFGWRFHLGDVAGAATLTFDDSDWRVVDVPHDFQIEQPWIAPAPDEKADNNDPAANIKSRLSSRGFKEMGKAWYRYKQRVAVFELTRFASLRGGTTKQSRGFVFWIASLCSQ